MYFAVAILVALVVFVARFEWKRHQVEKRLKDFVYPTAVVPGFGHTFSFLGRPKNILKYGLELLFRFPEKTMVIWLFHVPHIVIMKPEDIQILAPRLLEKEARYRYLADLIGDGLITSRGEKWKQNRRIINPTFTSTVLHSHFLAKFNRRNCELVQKLKHEVGLDKEFDVGPPVLHAFVKTICDTAIGCKEEFTENDISKLADSTILASSIITRRFYQPWLQSSVLFKMYAFVTGCTKLFDEVKEFQMQVLQKRRAQHQARKTQADDDEDVTERVNFIDRLLEKNEENFSDKEVYDEVSTILFAGSETNSLAVSFTLISLALNPDAQSKVHQELASVFGDSDRQPTHEDLTRLVFLEQCVKESLRRYTIVPVVLRQSDAELTLSDGSIIPPDTCVLVPLLGVHVNPIIYPDPFTWNPHNFDPDRVASRHPRTFIPFGFGPRTCLGNKYAMYSVKAMLSTLLRAFSVSTNETEIEMDIDFLLRKSNGFNIVLHENNRKVP